MRIHFVKSSRLNQLLDEILSQCPAVAPVNGIAQLLIEADANNVWITVQDDISVEAQQQIALIVSAHVPTFLPDPDWIQFRSLMSVHPVYMRIVTGYSFNSVLNSLLIPLLWQVGENRQLLGEVAHLWNLMVNNVPLDESEVEQLNSIAVGCNLPLQLNSTGIMQII